MKRLHSAVWKISQTRRGIILGVLVLVLVLVPPESCSSSTSARWSLLPTYPYPRRATNLAVQAPTSTRTQLYFAFTLEGRARARSAPST